MHVHDLVERLDVKRANIRIHVAFGIHDRDVPQTTMDRLGSRKDWTELLLSDAGSAAELQPRVQVLLKQAPAFGAIRCWEEGGAQVGRAYRVGIIANQRLSSV